MREGKANKGWEKMEQSTEVEEIKIAKSLKDKGTEKQTQGQKAKKKQD